MKNRIITLVFLLAFFYVGIIISNLEVQNQNDIEIKLIEKQNDKQLENINPKNYSKKSLKTGVNRF